MFIFGEEIRLRNSVLTIKGACSLFVSVHKFLEGFQNQKRAMKVGFFCQRKE